MTVAEQLYGRGLQALRPAARALAPLLGRRWPRVADGLERRRGAPDRLSRWAAVDRDPDRPLLWLHGASAGELVGAAPAVAELRERRPLQLLVTHFSPSGEHALPWLDPDAADVPPLDTPDETARTLETVRPDALVFAKLDVWPWLTRSARDLGVPLGLVNGTVSPDSSRLRWPVRRLLRPAHGRLDRAGASSAADADRLARLGVARDRMTVTGDASFDWALWRADRAVRDPGSPAARLRQICPAGIPVVVAGSTWPPDETLLLESTASLARRELPVSLVLVPHEPSPEAVERLRARAAETWGRAPLLWSRVAQDRVAGGEGGPGGSERSADAADDPALLVVDVMGPLAELYAAGDVAWVGGGLGDDGLHSVLEPAAAGVPVLFGDRTGRREADQLVDRGGARAVAPDRAEEVLAAMVGPWEERDEMGRAARAYVRSEAGAAVASADLIEELLHRPEPAATGPGPSASPSR